MGGQGAEERKIEPPRTEELMGDFPSSRPIISQGEEGGTGLGLLGNVLPKGGVKTTAVESPTLLPAPPNRDVSWAVTGWYKIGT